MAVYKPTLCSPFLSGVDARIGFHSETHDETLIKFLSCKVDTSNKNVTGYKIRILDSNNNQIFPLDNGEDDNISPITELQLDEFGYSSGGINSGVNGTTLKFPFFQNINNINSDDYISRNAIYYSDVFLADHIIMQSEVNPFSRDLTHMENINNWTLLDNQLTYNWPQDIPEEEKKHNAIVLDGDRVMSGDIILVAGNTNSACGLWVATADISTAGSGTITTVLRRITTISVTQRITVIKGNDFHNSSWECQSSSSVGGTITYVRTGAKWVDSHGREIKGFGSKDNTYKWEVTLYQGNYVLYESSSYGDYIKYTDVDPEWLDMTLSSGKIMGTTPERIQIGGVFGNTEADYLNGILPEGTSVDPLVLQGKYFGLSNSSVFPQNIFSDGNRLYVKNYDVSFGHVYPMANAFDAQLAERAQYCQFFEHSNNQEDILDGDIVNYTFTTSKPLSFYGIKNNQWNSYDSESQWIAETSVTERYIVISDTPIIGVSEGDMILLSNQSSAPEQNGVYTYFAVHAKNDGGNVQTKYCIKRAPSYDTWANYIGKIIYTISGDSISRTNLQSLASAGAYTLWNPLNTMSGRSPLYFVNERPIILFRNKFKENRAFELFDVSNNCPTLHTSSARSSSVIDGVQMKVGDAILFKNGQYATVVSLSQGTSEEISYEVGEPAGTVDGGDYFYITNGKTLGKLVFKWATGIASWTQNNATWDLHTAKIMHNTNTRTFISPWSGLKKNMEICLLDNKEVYTKSSEFGLFNVGSKWIKILDFNDKLFFINHSKISTTYGASDADGSTNIPTPLKPYDIEDNSVPWKYDIKFFFRSSDENPFYSYETPYIKLYKNGEEYSDLTMVGGEENLYVKTQSSSQTATDQFVTSDGKNFIVSMYTAQASITGRSVQLGAEYIQFGQSSWESYEWILYNSAGEIVQDTGKRYDKDISVTFYGLLNDSLYPIEYTVVLLVENDYGDILQYKLKLLVVPGSQTSFVPFGRVFDAKLDCATQSVLINFDGLTEQDRTYSIYRREYEVYLKPGREISGFYCSPSSLQPAEKKGKFFTDISCEHEISPKNEKYLYRDTNSGFIFQYNPKYGIDFPGYPLYEFTPTQTYKMFKGEWKPVSIRGNKASFKDFNIKNNRCYQYIAYPGDGAIETYSNTVRQTFANYNGKIWQVNSDDPTQGIEVMGTIETAASNGEGVPTNWQYWSISELIPEKLDIDAPIVKNQYRVDTDNIWLFKYSVDTGAQTQNFSKEEFQTFGRFPKFGFGNGNADSGNVSALIGSEIVPYSRARYIERLSKSRVTPLSSNEKVEMLDEWKRFCFSKNPKLLKDIKGQSWIVQILSNTNTPQNFVANVPDTISFQWKQIESTDNVIIYGEVDKDTEKVSQSYGDIEWKPLYQQKQL